jgi:hypothetical protein
MAGKNTATFGIYPTSTAAENAVDRLIAAGFSNQDISVLMADKQGAKEFATEKTPKFLRLAQDTLVKARILHFRIAKSGKREAVVSTIKHFHLAPLIL